MIVLSLIACPHFVFNKPENQAAVFGNKSGYCKLYEVKALCVEQAEM